MFKDIKNCGKLKQNKTDWEAEFDKLDNNVEWNNLLKEWGSCGMIRIDDDNLQTFIAKLLSFRQKEMDREFEKILADKKAHFKFREKLVIQETKKDLLKEVLEKLLKKGKDYYCTEEHLGYHDKNCNGCEISRERIKSLIEELK